QVPRRQLCDLVCKLDRARMCVRPVRIEGQLAHLLERRLAHLLPERVADLYREEAGERVEVAIALEILEVAAVAADDDRRLVHAHLREVEPQVIARRLAKVKSHACPSRRAASTSPDRGMSPSRRLRRARACGS